MAEDNKSIYDALAGDDQGGVTSSGVVVMRPRASSAEDGETLSSIFNEDVLLVSVQEQDVNLGVVANLEAIEPHFRSERRNVIVLPDVPATDLPDKLEDMLQARMHWDFTPDLTALKRDLAETMETVSTVLDMSQPIRLVLLHTKGVKVDPAKWHKDEHLQEGSVRCLRALTGSGPDVALRDKFRQVAGTKKPRFEVDEYVSSPIGISVFDGKHDVHRTPGIESSDDKPVTRWAYIVSGMARKPL